MKTTSDSTEDFWQYYYSPASTSTRKTATVSKKPPMVEVPRFLRCFRAMAQCIKMSRQLPNTIVSCNIQFTNLFEFFWSTLIGWQTTTSLVARNNRLHTKRKKLRCMIRCMLLSLKQFRGYRRPETKFLPTRELAYQPEGHQHVVFSKLANISRSHIKRWLYSDSLTFHCGVTSN